MPEIGTSGSMRQRDCVGTSEMDGAFCSWRECECGDCAEPLHLASMQANADFDAKRGHGFGDCLGAMDSARRAIKQNQKSIAQRFHLAAAKAGHFPANCRIMRL